MHFGSVLSIYLIIFLKLKLNPILKYSEKLDRNWNCNACKKNFRKTVTEMISKTEISLPDSESTLLSTMKR